MRAMRRSESAGINMLDTVMADSLSWETIPEFGSDHLPLLLIWGEDNKVERVHVIGRPNYPNVH